MTEQFDTEDWKDHNKQVQARKADRRDENTELVLSFCKNYAIDISYNTPYHLTLTKRDFKRLDVFPTSSKVRTYIGTTKSKIVDLKKYLLGYYNCKPGIVTKEIAPVVTEVTINGVQTCIDHIKAKLANIEKNKPNAVAQTVLIALSHELEQYL